MHTSKPGKRKAPKSPSLKKVARTYKQTHSKPKVNNEGARYFSDGANPYAIGSSKSKNTYKPKARQITVGGTRKGAPATIRKKGKAT